MIKNINFIDSINFTIKEIMKKDKNVVLFGLGVDDPKRIFNSTRDLKEQFGSTRVFDTPASENAMTGIGIGMSLNGLKPIMVHQRMDFFLLAMDQLINNAAKWKYMFGGHAKTPIVIRLIVGRGWGQGPTHSQNFQNLFANIPGLKVYIPSFPSTARNLLIDATKGSDPVIIIEHRWLHYINEKFDIKKIEKPIPIKKIKKGSDCTVVSMSYSTIEIIKIYETLKKNGFSIDHFDINIIRPLQLKNIFNSLKKTGKLLILDNSSHKFCSIGSEIISQLIQIEKNIFKKEPILLTIPEIPSPSSFYLTKDYYHNEKSIVCAFEKLFGKRINCNFPTKLHDIPDPAFKGPF